MRSVENFAHLIMQEPGSLSQVIQDQAGFYIDPGNADIPFTTMSQVGIKCFGSRGAKKNGPQYPKSFGIDGQ